jgi:hypothetical protein
MKKIVIGLLVAVSLIAVGCNEQKDNATERDTKTASEQLRQFQEAQPVPIFNSSQLRQNLIEIQTAQANATATTTFFFNQGVTDPIHSCPSIGFPIPGSYQLTNPEGVQRIGGGSSWERFALPQLEATGVYTGDTTGTTVICVDEDGKGYAHWWEGFVSTVAGPAEWNTETKQVEMTGAPSAEFSTGEK